MNIFKRVASWFRSAPQFHYAYICSSGVCYAVVRLDFPLQRPDAISVESLDASIIGKRWMGNQWTGRNTLQEAFTGIPSRRCLNSDLFHITGGTTDGEAITQQGKNGTEAYKKPLALQVGM